MRGVIYHHVPSLLAIFPILFRCVQWLLNKQLQISRRTRFRFKKLPFHKFISILVFKNAVQKIFKNPEHVGSNGTKET